MLRVKEKRILTNRALFANHLPMIGVLMETVTLQVVYVGERRGMSPFYPFFVNLYGLFSPCRRNLTVLHVDTSFHNGIHFAAFRRVSFSLTQLG